MIAPRRFLSSNQVTGEKISFFSIRPSAGSTSSLYSAKWWGYRFARSALTTGRTSASLFWSWVSILLPGCPPPKSPQSAKSRLSDWQCTLRIMARLAYSILPLTCHPVLLEKRGCCSELAPLRFYLLASSELYTPGIEM
ncbi:hypothetical protein RHMOL_Rhmol03G0198400 [Rhododendron molle]|uniref:Uncharacterized protein n=1 Tax=Rhododendron molle TaxID=49168 RepID=A0ACC0PHP4_RHOML|nr:hypothetical protein RHMOL_Rhmol03G0198400 [Rhododendron molle]